MHNSGDCALVRERVSRAPGIPLKELNELPWLVWLSGLSASLQTKGLLVLSLVREHAYIVVQ